jgi:TRAP transporter TAXI family solute receptor
MVIFRMAVSPGETRTSLRNHCWRGLACASLLFFALLCGAAAETETRFFRIGTAATSGSFFEIGGVVASAISSPVDGSACEQTGGCGVPGLVAVAQATRGSMENLRLVSSGQIESAFAQADLAAMAYAGTGPFAFEGAMPRLRVIAALFPEALHVIVRADSPVRTIADLAGKTVSIGEAGSGTAVNAKVMLAAAGLGDGDVTCKNLRPAQATEEITTGTVDALIIAGSYPIPAIQELAATTPIRLVPVIGDIAIKLEAEFRAYGPTTIPASSYFDVDTDTASVGFYALWVVSADANEKLVYDITRSLWSDGAHRLFDANYPIGNKIVFANALKGISLPLHLGAERFYREQGLSLAGVPTADEPAGETPK